VGFIVTDEMFCIRQIQEKKWEYNETVHQLFIDFKKSYNSVKREILYHILIEFGVPMKLVRLIKMCLNETYSKAHIGVQFNFGELHPHYYDCFGGAINHNNFYFYFILF
jgi:hypothetical protein